MRPRARRPLARPPRGSASGGADGLLDGNPSHYDIAIYAFPGRLSFAAEQNGMPLKQGFFGGVRGSRLVLDVPTLDGRIFPTLFTMRVGARSRGGRNLVTTPPSCPKRGWALSVGVVGASGPGGAPVGASQHRSMRVACHR